MGSVYAGTVMFIIHKDSYMTFKSTLYLDVTLPSIRNFCFSVAFIFVRFT